MNALKVSSAFVDESADRSNPFRCTFAAAAFWVIGWFMPPEKSSAKDKWLLFLLGALGLYGFMFLYLAGLSKTTPVSSSIFTSLQPIWVFLMMIFFYKEKATTKKNNRNFYRSDRSIGLYFNPAK